MEWMLDVNEILKDDITKITNSLIPPGFEGDVRSIRRMQDSLSRLVDTLGELSAAEQGLSKVITTAEKLRTADSHALYLLRDAAAKDGKGEVVGMLKVGRKHLFLFDAESVREVEPLCVLDFYVVRSYQRRGFGKALFDHMLRDTQTSPHQLAVDGPSLKMESFLAKNYDLHQLRRQSNNFAISPRFFDSLPPHQLLSKSSASTPSQGAVGRYTAHKPHSSIGNVIHGGGAGGGGAAAAAHVPRLTASKSSASTPSQGAVGRYTAHKPHSSIGNVIHGGGAGGGGAAVAAHVPRLTASKSSASTPSQGAVGRYTAHKPHSSIGNVIHGGGAGGGGAAVAAHVPRLTARSEGSGSERGLESARATATALRPRSLSVPAATATATTPAPVPALAAPVPEQTPAGAPPPEQTPAGAPPRRDSQLTDKGFFDVKFHHKKLW